MQISFDRAFPLALTFTVGFAIFGLGAAIGTVPGPYWLPFFGTLLGSGFTAGTGYWLISRKIYFERDIEINTAARAIHSMINERKNLLAITGGDDDGNERLFLSDSNHFMLYKQKRIFDILINSLVEKSIEHALIVEELSTKIHVEWNDLLNKSNVFSTMPKKYDQTTFEEREAITAIRQNCRNDITACEAALQKLRHNA